jgi:predicted DNA repair protein MutK
MALVFSLVGLILTLFGAGVAAYGVLLSDTDARALATMQWKFNQQLYENLLFQSKCAMWGLIVVAIGTLIQIAGMVLSEVMQIVGTVLSKLFRRSVGGQS